MTVSEAARATTCELLDADSRLGAISCSSMLSAAVPPPGLARDAVRGVRVRARGRRPPIRRGRSIGGVTLVPLGGVYASGAGSRSRLPTSAHRSSTPASRSASWAPPSGSFDASTASRRSRSGRRSKDSRGESMCGSAPRNRWPTRRSARRRQAPELPPGFCGRQSG